MPRAPPYVHFSWPGSVLRSFGQPSATSYGPDTSSAPMALGTALNEVSSVVVCAAAGEFTKRPPSAMPTPRPTASVKRIVIVLLITVLRPARVHTIAGNTVLNRLFRRYYRKLWARSMTDRFFLNET